jgi:hypothetical protein
MELIDRWHVKRLRGDQPPADIELLQGNLADIPAAHGVDALVVSAFPDSYTPNAGTLFEALKERGLDMRTVARNKQVDERKHLGCWLSTPLSADIVNRFHFRRIMCFEPLYPEFVKNSGVGKGGVEESVGFVFRCLNNFVVPGRDNERNFGISSVAMPLLATGNQGVPVGPLFQRLLEAAKFWLEDGLPIQRLKMVAFRKADLPVAKQIFLDARRRDEAPLDARESRPYDVFISYSRKQSKEADEFVRALREHLPGRRIFFDRASIPQGGRWIKTLSDALQNVRVFVALLSPDYSASPVCWDEFQCAKLKEYTTRESVIKTVRVFSEKDMPPMMAIYSYIDCAEGDLEKLRQSAAAIAG